ncbi:MAG: PEP-CTERM sorting domain-containing protein [Rubrivivax sp.]
MKLQQLAAAALLALAGAAQAAITYGSNLIVNGDAEAGTDGWLAYGSYVPIQSVNYGSNWVLPTQPGPADRGSRMFVGGTGAYSVGYQLLDLGEVTTQPLAYELSGWLGGWQSQGDNALLYVQFLDLTGVELGGAAIGPVLPADRNNVTGLFYRETADWLPVGTAQLGFWLSMERQGGGDNDGYADNLSFMLAAPAAVPEPAGLALLGLGVLALQARRKRMR